MQVLGSGRELKGQEFKISLQKAWVQSCSLSYCECGARIIPWASLGITLQQNKNADFHTRPLLLTSGLVLYNFKAYF